MNQFKSWALTLFFAGFLSACGSNEDRLKERAQVEARENARQQVQISNDYQSQQIYKMELDLAKRQRYYDALSGTYEGSYEGRSGKIFRMRLIFTSNLPYVPSNRVRTFDEIQYDLNNLHLTIEKIIWDEEVDMTMGCIYENVRPKMSLGQIHLASAACKMSLNLKISDQLRSTESEPNDQSTEGAGLASKILEGTAEIKSLNGTGQSVFSADPFKIEVVRVGD